MATSNRRVSASLIRPGDLALGGTPSSQTVHLLVRHAPTGIWAVTAACGAAAWTQRQLDAQLAFPLRLDGIHPSRRCARDFCRVLWATYDRRRA